MRVVVVGASGNAGTALLRALSGQARVTSILGIARRLPDESSEPYNAARWATFDIARQGSEEAVVTELAELFTGADAVVHLAWLIQPNHDRDLLRRTNVLGSQRVARATALAGVPHLVVASSVGVYSPVHDDTPRDESWDRGGFPTSHYSVDKVAQERALDLFADAHPEVTVARLRPSLIFQGPAGSEIGRYFFGRLAPLGLLRGGRPPALPLPPGLRVQAVHGDDVAQAYALAVVQRAGGAFNIAAEPVLQRTDLADVVDHGRVLDLPAGPLRRAVSLSWQARLQPTDPGWLDMAMGVPVLDTTRARTELGWRPRHTAHEALASLVEGMAEGRGSASPSMAPRRSRPGATRGRHTRPVSPAAAGGSMAPEVPSSIDRELLGLYMSDHLTGSTAGLNRIERMASAYSDTPLAAGLAEVAEQIRAEREFLTDLIHTLGLTQRPHRQAAAWLGERVARLKANGRPFSRSPMTMVLESELMRSGVLGKLGLWETLAEHAAELRLDRAELETLADQARAQAETLTRTHEYARSRAFRKGRDVSA